VVGLTKWTGEGLGSSGILVDAIASAVLATPMNATIAPWVLTHIPPLVPMKRVGRADELVELIARLASASVSYPLCVIYDISGRRATYLREGEAA
jgi:NAD(P)-dependent dehydrogenase (short-subunit alcohol dehydrogenase family)